MNLPSLCSVRFARFAGWLAAGVLFASLNAAERALDVSEIQKHGEMPAPVSRERPAYPFGLVRAGIGGKVTVTFIIDREGRVVNPVIHQSNNPLFERPAIDAILKWKFKPGKVDGHPVNVRAMQVLEFAVVGAPTDSLWQLKKVRDHASLPPELQWVVAPEPVATAFPV